MEWWNIEPTITHMVLDNMFAFFDEDLTVLDFSPFKNVVSIEIGDKSFTYVKTVCIAELPKLESVKIGFHSFFHADEYNGTQTPDCHFYAYDCPELKELKIGSDSFVYYSRFVVKNLPSLEEIMIGDSVYCSQCFSFSSLELKGERMEPEVKNRSSKAENTQDWCVLFQEVRTSVD